MLDEGALTIYVDGSMYGSPRRGGIGIRFVWVNAVGDAETWDHALPATMGATNNEMELEAPTEALKLACRGGANFDLAQFNKIVIRTDSMYVYENWKNAAWTWRDSKWTTRGGAAVLNSRAWKSLIAEMKRMSDRYRLVVRFEWTQGKKGKNAKDVDKLAKQSASSPSFGRKRPNLVAHKQSKESLELGSVKVTGQTMRIRIIQAQYLPPPRRRSRYMYEVVDQNDRFHGKVDRAEFDLHLKRGCTYIVRMNDRQENPRIEELLDEVVEDLTPYIDALKALGQPSTAQQIANRVALVTGVAMTSDAAKRRLDQLVESGQVFPTRSKAAGRPYLYRLPGVPAKWHGDA